jgi:hypothetical protein
MRPTLSLLIIILSIIKLISGTSSELQHKVEEFSGMRVRASLAFDHIVYVLVE